MKHKKNLHQNELDQLAQSIKIETTLSKLENKTKGLSSSLEDKQHAIDLLTKENQKLKNELLKFTTKFGVKEQELQKNVSKEVLTANKLMAERDDLKKEIQSLKANLKDEIITSQKLQSQYDQLRREVDTKEKKFFSEFATLHKKIDEDKTIKDHFSHGNYYLSVNFLIIFVEKGLLVLNLEQSRSRNEFLEKEYKRMETMIKYVRREIKSKTLSPESLELLEEKMILSSAHLGKIP